MICASKYPLAFRSVWIYTCINWKVVIMPISLSLVTARLVITTTYQLLQWRHNDHAGFSNHRHFDCLLNRWFRRRSKKTSKLRVTGLCEGNPPVTSPKPVAQKMFPFGDIIMKRQSRRHNDFRYSAALKVQLWKCIPFYLKIIIRLTD